MNNYSDKSPEYFSHARTEIEPLLPANGTRVLEIGCGAGGTLAWLKAAKGYSYTAGIEISPSAAEIATTKADDVVEADAERFAYESRWPDKSFDLILCLDVLEHMVDPWAFVRDIQRLLRNGGRLVASVPNVRNVDVLAPLLFAGKWDYTAAGILDRTHLRFFTRRTAQVLASQGNLRIAQTLPNLPARTSKRGLLNIMTGGIFKDFLAVQYLLASTREGA